MLQNRKPITVSHFQIGYDKCGVSVLGSVSEFSLPHQVSYRLEATTDDVNGVFHAIITEGLNDKHLVVGVILNHQDGSVIVHSSAFGDSYPKALLNK